MERKKKKDLNQNEYSMRNLTARLLSTKQVLLLTAGNHNTLTLLKHIDMLNPQDM